MKVFGASMLVAGTTIGAGILALPVLTGMAGFFPAAWLLVAYWLFMLYTAFLILETTLWFSKDTNLVTMAKDTMGVFGQGITWVVYLFLLYALTTAYLAGLSPLVLDFFESTTGERPEAWVGYIPLLIIFGFFIYRGTSWVDHINRWMMVGLGVTFLILLFDLVPKVELEKLSYQNFASLPMAVSLVSVSFGYHIIIPSLVTYLDRDVKKCKQAIVWGSLIPLMGYLVWEGLTLGTIPLRGDVSFEEAMAAGSSSSELLIQLSSSLFFRSVLRIFSFFLIVTSFLGVSLSLFDFLADGLKIKKNHLGRGMLYLLTFGPPLYISQNPKIFLEALDYAGAFGVVLLLAFLPACMVFFGRPKHAQAQHFKTKGGNSALFMVVLISLLVMGHEIFVLFS